MMYAKPARFSTSMRPGSLARLKRTYWADARARQVEEDRAHGAVLRLHAAPIDVEARRERFRLDELIGEQASDVRLTFVADAGAAERDLEVALGARQKHRKARRVAHRRRP